MHANEQRFVILVHDDPVVHWDFFLESDGVLKAWRFQSEPSVLPVLAQPNADHRLHYLDYEGPVSQGRGFVTGWDRGTYRKLSSKEDVIVVELRGSRLSGKYRLERISDEEGWRFCSAAD